MKTTEKLKLLLSQNELLIAPGVFDGLSARLVEQAKFPLVYASGGAIARSCGLPDLGLLSFTEVLQRMEQIASSTSLPVIADADTGFGNVLNVSRTVKLFEQTGVAAIHLEDQQFPKRCGHLEGKSLISTAEMINKLKVARDVLVDDDFVLIARTDAIAVEGFEQALARANAYREAGADVIFVEAPETIEQIAQIAKQIPGPKLINMFYGGKTPLMEAIKLQHLGYRLMIIPSDLQRTCIRAMQNTLKNIAKNGNSSEIEEHLATFQEREEIIKTKDYLSLDRGH